MTSGAPSRGRFALILSVGLAGARECPGRPGRLGGWVGSEVLLEEKLRGENQGLGDLLN